MQSLEHHFLDLAKKRRWKELTEILSKTPDLAGAQPNSRWTALHQAASAGEEEVVKYLLENAKTSCGKTPMEVATLSARRYLETQAEGPEAKRRRDTEGQRLFEKRFLVQKGLSQLVKLGPALREAAAQLRMMLPLASGNLINYAVTFVTLHVVGSEGTSAVAAAGLALALYTCLGRNLIMGLCGAVDTISSQAAGAQRLDLLGPIFRRSCLFLLLHLLPFGLFSFSALLWLPHLTDPDVARNAARFLLLLLPDLAAQCLWRPMNRVLASQRITCPFMVVSLLVLLCHYFFCRFFVSRHGFLGAAVATSCSGMVTLLLGAVAVCMVGANRTIWGGRSTPGAIQQAGCGWRALAALAYPSAAMRMLESSGFSGVVTASALLPLAKVEVDIMSLSLNAYGCFFSLFPALSVCADTRVGNAIGRGAVEDAMRAMRVAVLLALPTATVVSMVFVLPVCKQFLEQLLRVDSLDSRVQQGLEVIFVIFVCGFYYIDGLQTALSGAVRGTGQQQKGARICVLAYWILGIPSALALGFGGFNATGLWLGMLVGPLVQLIFYARLLWKLNWVAVAASCEERLVSHQEMSEELMGA